MAVSRAGAMSVLRNIRTSISTCATGGVPGRIAARLHSDDFVVAVASFAGARRSLKEGAEIGVMHTAHAQHRIAFFDVSPGREDASIPPNRPPFFAQSLTSSSLSGSTPMVMRPSAARAMKNPTGMRNMSAGAGSGGCESSLGVAEGSADVSIPAAAAASAAGNEQALEPGLDPGMLTEAASSTLWTRFYSGDPEFWVNIYYAQEAINPPPPPFLVWQQSSV